MKKMFWMSISREALFSDACLVLIVAGLVCAAVRWFHMCAPYSDNEKVFYPARRQMSLFFALPVLLVPYVLMPSGPAVMTYAVSVWIIYISLAVSVLYRIYFRWELDGKFLWKKIVNWCELLWMAALLLVLVICPHFFSSHERLIYNGSAVAGMLSTVVAVFTVSRLKKDIDLYMNDNYSNPEDFPLNFARKVLWLPLVLILLGWVLFLTKNPWFFLANNLLYSVVFVWLLCVILKPQEGRALPDLQPVESIPQELCCTEGSIEDEVLTIIEHHFKEPHLLKTEVLAAVSRGNAQRADKFIALHGYYRLVNMFRLEYARLYKLRHPDAIQDVVAAESGFTSRVTFYKARKSVSDVYEEVSSRVEKLFQ